MSDPEKYARPGLYLDEDDHGRLIEENREPMLQERRQQLLRELEDTEAKLEKVESQLR